MQINNHIGPNHFGHGSRPDHAANGTGKAPQFQPATAETEPATTTDTTTAVAPVEETEGPRIPGNSVAHRARAQLAKFAELSGHTFTLDGHNFGWLVSQIARGMFDPSAYTTDGEGTDGEGTDGGETVVAPAETTEAGTIPVAPAEGSVASLLDTLGEGGEAGVTLPTEEPIDPIVDLVDTLLEDGEDDSETT